MGISGLMTFMKLNGCCEQVRLSDIADAYRSKTGNDPVLLVDLPSVIRLFYTSSPRIKTVSGELKKFMENLKTFVNNCKELRIELHFVVDGKKPTYKYRLWENKIPTTVDFLKGIYSGQPNTHKEVPFPGVLLHIVSNYLLRKENCKFSRGIHEADDVIIKYLKTEDCFAVLTNDTDLFLTGSVHYCLTIDNLNLQFMTFLNFNRHNLSKLLKINASQFPLFASLCFSEFHFFNLFKLYKHKEIDKESRFFRAAELVKNFTSKEELIEHVFPLLNPGELTCLERRLGFYFGEGQEGKFFFKFTRNFNSGNQIVMYTSFDSCSAALICFKSCHLTPDKILQKKKKEEVRHTPQNHWDEIVRFAEERHVTGKAHYNILAIIQDRVLFFNPTCENIFMPLPDYAVMKKIYGILFFEHPNPLIFVTHFSLAHYKKGSVLKKKVRTVIVDRRPHPGLLKLWSPKKSSSLQTSRLTVFCEAIHDKLTAEDFSRLNIPVDYVFPILVAFFLLWELDKKFEELDVETILIQAVLANRLTVEQSDQLPEEYHLEALNLSSWFFCFFGCLHLLNSVCGEPFCRYQTDIINFFDGKIMHYAYGKMKRGENPWTSFSQYEKEYKNLISILYKLGRICGHVEP